jgi:hypothetical protein
MNCDQVFDVLTRGPFPTGAASDDIVERHLAGCGDCRRLAHALRPAIELFEEAVAPEESRGLPAYWGEACQASSDVTAATKTGRIPRAPRLALARRTRRDSAHTNGLMFAGAALLGVVMAAAIHSALPRDQAARAEGIDAILALDPAQVCLTNSRGDDEPTMSSTAMIRPSGDPQTIPPPEIDLACCHDCHGTDGRHTVSVSHEATRRVGLSCQVCHL